MSATGGSSDIDMMQDISSSSSNKMTATELIRRLRFIQLSDPTKTTMTMKMMWPCLAYETITPMVEMLKDNMELFHPYIESYVTTILLDHFADGGDPDAPVCILLGHDIPYQHLVRIIILPTTTTTTTTAADTTTTLYPFDAVNLHRFSMAWKGEDDHNNAASRQVLRLVAPYLHWHAQQQQPPLYHHPPRPTKPIIPSPNGTIIINPPPSHHQVMTMTMTSTATTTTTSRGVVPTITMAAVPSKESTDHHDEQNKKDHVVNNNDLDGVSRRMFQTPVTRPSMTTMITTATDATTAPSHNDDCNVTVITKEDSKMDVATAAKVVMDDDDDDNTDELSSESYRSPKSSAANFRLTKKYHHTNVKRSHPMENSSTSSKRPKMSRNPSRNDNHHNHNKKEEEGKKKTDNNNNNKEEEEGKKKTTEQPLRKQYKNYPKKIFLSSNASPNNIDPRYSKSKIMKRHTDDIIEIPLWNDNIMTLFQRLGYQFEKDENGNVHKYWLHPTNGNNSNNSIEGKDYVTSEYEFRHYLCVHGIRYDQKLIQLRNDEMILLERYVRTSVITCLPYFSSTPAEGDMILPRKAIQYLCQLHYATYDSDRGGYYLRHHDDDDHNNNDDNSLFFQKDSELLQHVARHGLPHHLPWDNITLRDRLSLEVFVACQLGIDVFSQMEPELTDVIVPKHSNMRSCRKSTMRHNSSRSVSSMNGSITKSVRSQKKLSSSSSSSSSTSDDGATQVTIDESHQQPTVVTTATTTNGGGGGGGGTTMASSSTIMATTSPYSSTKNTTTNGTAMTSSSTIMETASPYSSTKNITDEEVSLALVYDDMRHTYTIDPHASEEEKLQQCLRNLNDRTHDESPTYDLTDEKSSFAKNLDTMFQLLYHAVRRKDGEEGRSLSSSSAICVNGVPGIGKTSGIKYCCRAIERIYRDRHTEGPMPITCYVNAAHFGASTSNPIPSMMAQMIETLQPQRGGSAVLPTTTIANLKKLLRKQCLILVIDEIDILISKSSNTTMEETPQMLFDLCHNPDVKLVIVGITNHLGDEIYDKLHHDLFPQIVTFQSYSSKEILHMLQARVGGGQGNNVVVDPKAMEWIAKKVASNHGDARRAFEYMATAIQAALSEEPPSTKVLIKHAMTINSTKPSLRERLEGLPDLCRMVLCVLCRCNHEGKPMMGAKELRHEVFRLMEEHQFQDDYLSTTDYETLLSTLVDGNLLLTDRNGHYQLGVSVDETITALQKGTNGARYQRIIESNK